MVPGVCDAGHMPDCFYAQQTKFFSFGNQTLLKIALIYVRTILTGGKASERHFIDR